MTISMESSLRRLRAIRHSAGARLDDADYRAILMRCALVSSSTQIKHPGQVDAVLAEFRRIGIATQAPRKPLSPQQKKIWALWQQLADAGLVRARGMSGLLAFVKRQTGVDALDFMTGPQELQLTESLKHWLSRRVNTEAGAGGG